MRRCDSDTCPTPDLPVEEGSVLTTHAFAGYGFYATFHPACCPVRLAGDTCPLQHSEAAAR